MEEILASDGPIHTTTTIGLGSPQREPSPSSTSPEDVPRSRLPRGPQPSSPGPAPQPRPDPLSPSSSLATLKDLAARLRAQSEASLKRMEAETAVERAIELQKEEARNSNK